MSTYTIGKIIFENVPLANTIKETIKNQIEFLSGISENVNTMNAECAIESAWYNHYGYFSKNIEKAIADAVNASGFEKY